MTINNKLVQRYYDKLSKNLTNPLQTRNKAKDFSKYDVDLLKRLSGQEKSLLDLGSGTGLLINNLHENFKNILAVEKYPEFSRFIDCSKNIEVKNIDLLQFETSNRFDVISAFGVLNFFSGDETVELYRKIIRAMHPDSIFVLKHQMGIKDDVVIEGWSDELQCDYYSEYRHVDRERAILRECGFNVDEQLDIYPDEYNRFENTRFFAFVCSCSR